MRILVTKMCFLLFPFVFSQKLFSADHSQLSYKSVDPQFKIETCAQPAKFLAKNNKIKNSSYVALMSYLCEWSDAEASMKALDFANSVRAEVLRYTSLWKEVGSGLFSKKPELHDYQALSEAMNTYYAEHGSEAPILLLDPATALTNLVRENKMNPVQIGNLYFLLKLYDCELLDADSYGSVAHYLTSSTYALPSEAHPKKEITLQDNAQQILRTLVTLERGYRQKEKPSLFEKEKKCPVQFQKSPIELFARAIASSPSNTAASLSLPQRQKIIELSVGTAAANSSEGLLREGVASVKRHLELSNFERFGQKKSEALLRDLEESLQNFQSIVLSGAFD